MDTLTKVGIFFAALAFAGGGVVAIVRSAFLVMDWKAAAAKYNEHAAIIDAIENGSSEL